MSEKFGLDWKDKGFERMNYFIEIMKLDAKKKEKENKKINKQYGKRSGATNKHRGRR